MGFWQRGGCDKRPDRRAWQSGNAAIIFAFTLPIIVGVCGFGGEVGYWYYKKQNLQSAADMAAYAGIVSLKGGGSLSTITSDATTSATTNGWSSTNGTISVNNPPTSGAHQDSYSVEVILSQNLPRFFTGIYSSSPVTETVRSVATAAGSGACVLGLNPTASQEINVSGSGNLSATNCDVVANSNASNAINMSGSAQLTADCIVAVGSVATTSGLHLQKCTTATTHASSVADPYAGVPTPSMSGTCITISGTPTTLYPGWYCHGLSTSWANIVFQPGLYVVSGGNLSLSAGTSNATGSGVTFWIQTGHTMAVSGSATVSFSAPTSGTYSGLVFFGDRTATSGNNAFSGGTGSTIVGAIYFPTQNLTYSGSAGSGTTCTQIVASTITISGSANFTHACTGDGLASIYTIDGQTGSMRTVE
jgi:hypothetical protein